MLDAIFLYAASFMATGDDQSDDQIAVRVAQLQRDRAIAADFTTKVLKNRPLPIPDNDPWNEDDILLRRESRFAALSRMWRWDVVESAAKFTMIWDGNTFIRSNEARKMMQMFSQPNITFWEDCLPFFLAYDGPTILGGMSLADALASATELSRKSENGMLRLEVALDAQRLNLAEIIFQTQPQLRLASVTYDIYGAPGDAFAGKIKLRVHYHVEQWADEDPTEPLKAFRDAYAYGLNVRQARQEPPEVNRMVFQRQPLQADDQRPVTPDAFSMEIPNGWAVNDERYNIRYESGAREIEIDGAGFLVNRPLQGDVGATLPDLFDNPAEIQQLDSVAMRSSTYAPAQHNAGLIAVLAGIASFCAAYFLPSLIRWRNPI
jgi:hypothetical protein